MANPYFNPATYIAAIVNDTRAEASDINNFLTALEVSFDSISALIAAFAAVTASTAELNILDGATLSTAELNILDGATLTTAQLNYLVGVTSSIQTQLNLLAPLLSPSLTGTPLAPTAVPGTNTTQIATTAFAQALAFIAALPLQTGNSGKFVTTNGTTASWDNIIEHQFNFNNHIL